MIHTMTKLKFIFITALLIFMSCNTGEDSIADKEDDPIEDKEQEETSFDETKIDDRVPNVYDGFQLVWNDEFDIDGPLDDNDWTYWWGKHGARLQHYQDSNTEIKEGQLIIEARKERVENVLYDPNSTKAETARYANYTSAQVTTDGKHEFKFGRIEVRAKIPSAKGAWPAIWTLGTEGQWPSNGEIDLLELYRKDDKPVILANYAWQNYAEWNAVWDSYIEDLTTFTRKDSDWLKKYHVWRMDWNEDTIGIYLDDVLLNTVDAKLKNKNTSYGDVSISQPFQQSHYLLLNLAIGSLGGNPQYSTFPMYYYIDYVRIYQYDKYLP